MKLKIGETMNAETLIGLIIIHLILVIISITILYRFLRSSEIELNDIDYIVMTISALVPEIFLLAFLMYLIFKNSGRILVSFLDQLYLKNK